MDAPASDAVRPGGPPRRPYALTLWHRFMLAFLGLVAAVLLVNGCITMWLAYEEASASAVRVEQEKADAAADRVTQFIADIEQQMGWTTRPEWSRVALDQRRYDFIRLLRQARAITEIIHVDVEGREQMKLSRLDPDAIGSGADYRADPRFVGTMRDRTWYGPVTFRRGSEPFMAIGIAHAGRNAGATIAEVNLKLVWEVLTSIQVGGSGYAYVTDETGRLIAHPDMSLVLRDTDLSGLPQVRSAMEDLRASTRPQRPRVSSARSVDGQSVLAAHAAIPKLRWIVFVEQPTSEALAPVYTALYQTLALLALGVVLAGAAGYLLSRRLIGPIRQLQAGAERLGKGDLAQRIPVRSRDEIGTLALRFNEMAERIQEAQETLEARVAQRTLELSKSLQDLRDAQDRLVQTEKLASLGQLTAGIAHEIKNPLNFVNNFADLSRELVTELEELVAASADEALKQEVKDLAALLRSNLERIVQHGRRADSIVKNMLAHSRDGLDERRPVDLNAAIEEAVNLAYHGARAERPDVNIRIEKDFDPAVGRVELYPQEFNRVLINMVANGIYAANKRKQTAGEAGFEPVLAVTSRGHADSIEVRVRDNGIGIPPEVRARLFEPFFTTKPPGEGTGLGLSISHDIIVKRHGGSIHVESEPGAFTEFQLTLPRTPPPEVKA